MVSDGQDIAQFLPFIVNFLNPLQLITCGKKLQDQLSQFSPWFGIHWWFLLDPIFTVMVLKWWFSSSSTFPHWPIGPQHSIILRCPLSPHLFYIGRDSYTQFWRNFKIYIHQRYWSVLLLWCLYLVWYKGSIGIIGWVGRCSSSSISWENLWRANANSFKVDGIHLLSHLGVGFSLWEIFITNSISYNARSDFLFLFRAALVIYFYESVHFI